jgi:superfamily II DNA or RNA helicase
VSATLYDLIPREERPGNDVLLERFLEYVSGRRLQLYPVQESAILELFDEKNLILNTPTGSGKSLVATALHFQAIARGRRSVYTCPIKALVNEKFLALCREFGPDNVGLSTGDASVNRDAPILCCTAEILANIALREGAAATVRDVVMDEFHYYADRERGVAWQVPLLTLPQARFLLMSATLGDTSFFEGELTRLNGRPTATVSSTDRPVPLAFEYSELPLAKTLETLIARARAPVYVVHFTQLDAAQSAQDFTSINVCTREEKAAIANVLEGVKFSSPYGPEIKKWLRHGIGLHHAGLLPKYRVLVEQLAQKGVLKVICGTDTLGVGINVPIRTVLFTRLCKFDGQKTGILSARDFHQISGRAGRKGFDDQGWVVAQAPEHVIENLKLAEKSARDGKKSVKRQPPEKNFVNWDKNTFSRLMAAPPERLASRFQVSHAMLLNVLSREGDGCAAMQQLLRDCHEPPKAKKAHTQRAWQLFRSLLDRKIVEFINPRQPRADSAARSAEGQNQHRETDASLSPGERAGVRVGVEHSESLNPNQTSSIHLSTPNLPGPSGFDVERSKLSVECSADREAITHKESQPPSISNPAGARKLRVNVELQDDFSMDQVLSLYLLETIPLMDPLAPDYALVLLTLVESILEDPDIILRKQLDKVKDRKMAELKADGIEYEQRMEELEKCEHPKPNREFVYSTFNDFAARHPWVGQENIRPKSIAREMFEEFRSFGDYIKLYELQRAEGVLLRHLNSVFKVLAQTVPDQAKNDQLREMELYLGTMIRQVDSSLLDEWEKMRDPNYRAGETKEVRPPGAEEAAADITRDAKAFTATIRNRIFMFLRGLVIEEYDQALAGLNSPADADNQPWTAERLRVAFDQYHVDHQYLCLDPNARNVRHTYVVPAEDKKSWRVQQMLVDPDERNDWVAEFEVDLAESRKLSEPFLRLRRLGSLT